MILICWYQLTDIKGKIIAMITTLVLILAMAFYSQHASAQVTGTNGRTGGMGANGSTGSSSRIDTNGNSANGQNGANMNGSGPGVMGYF